MITWNVYKGRKLIDTTFTGDKCNPGGAPFTAEMVKDGLVNHDGYDPDIRVVKARKLSGIKFQSSIQMAGQ